jgi:diaminohydroxyphosphoribosylaminopyrimidine deaminase / 5-amino-6-(5-phosphoribosylamino)uracil reductase
MSESTTAFEVEGHDFDVLMMRRAIELAKQGLGYVEPNPMVGCVVVKNQSVVAEGFHQRFGEAHAEVNALMGLSPELRQGSTIYITLEPCTHHGKTPPCIDLVLASKPIRVIIGVSDPFPQVAGSGIAQLRDAGIRVNVGIESNACRRLIAPFSKRQNTGLPWIIAKWAMTLDGRMATHTGESKWITNEASRSHAHRIRGNMDAIVVGVGTAIKDDPMLNARPTGARTARRVVMDNSAKLSLHSQLVATAKEFPTLVACGPNASSSKIAALRSQGCEVWQSTEPDSNARTLEFLRYLGGLGCTNVLIDGGPRLHGSLFDQKLIDEVHLYLGSQILGGLPNLVPNLGSGATLMNQAIRLEHTQVESLAGDFFVSGDCVY